MNYLSIKAAAEVLKLVKKYKASLNKNSKYSKAFLFHSKNSSYLSAYKVALENLDYDILLDDESILQFEERTENHSGTKFKIHRFAFMETPYEPCSYHEFLIMFGLPSEEETEEFRADYEQFLVERSTKNIYYAIRYDCSEKEYVPGIHPYSHVHIGIDESLSIPCSKELTPLAFVLFILKTRYYPIWKDAMLNCPPFNKEYRLLKSTLSPVDQRLFCAEDITEFHLH